MLSRLYLRFGLIVLLLAVSPVLLPSRSRADDLAVAQDDNTIEVQVEAPRVANVAPSDTFPSVATALRFEPLVDLETRNMAEAQGDLVIRGGTFETSGIQLGAASLYDPQTGHYLLELPVDPLMLGPPVIETGLGQSLNGFNATTGSAHYSFSGIDANRLLLTAGAGDHESDLQEAYGALSNLAPGTLGKLGFDLSAARSESDGSRSGGDNDLDRLAGRMQWRTNKSQTDLLLGTQHKNFSWPYLYALKQLHDLVGSSGIESEDLHTSLLSLNHRQDLAGKGSFEATAFVRENKDDYEFDRSQPGLFNDFRHTTRMLGGALSSTHTSGQFELRNKAEVVADEIESTALTFGPFQSRTNWKVAMLPGVHFDIDSVRTFWVRGGAGYASSNREGGRASPLSEVQLVERENAEHQMCYYGEISQSSQLPGYTALDSNPASGLFRGNPNLSRTISTNYEVGARRVRPGIDVQAAVFYRTDDDLVDWTYQSAIQPFASRTAANVDVHAIGAETVAKIDFELANVIVGYTYLQKHGDYGAPLVDASFYALNYPRHRATAAVIVPLRNDLAIRVDNEFRAQVSNALRSSSDTAYYLGSASLNWTVEALKGLEVAAIVDNFTNENFEEVPGVPGVGRSIGALVKYSW